MATLPTLTVSSQQAEYLLGIFGSVAAYRAWLLEQIKREVMQVELADARRVAQEHVETRRVDLEMRLEGISVD